MNPNVRRDQADTDPLITSKMIHIPPSSSKVLIQNSLKRSRGKVERKQ